MKKTDETLMNACLPAPGRLGSFFSLFCVSGVSSELSFGVSVSRVRFCRNLRIKKGKTGSEEVELYKP
jgi:hypothetical protein